MQYVDARRERFILIAPRVNVESDPAYTVFSILRYTAAISERLSHYTSLQLLNIFDGHGHVKSYQWTRLGLQTGRTQIGLAANVDEAGRDPTVKFSVGRFVRREIF